MSSTRVDIVIAPMAEHAAMRVADLIVHDAAMAVRERGRFTLALAGGRTPLAAYARLAAASGMPWARTHLFWSDERCIPPDNPDSNFGAAAGVLVSRVPIPPDHVHRIRGEAEPREEARRYESVLREIVRGDPPRLDVILLGVGEDGHTASLFPGSPALDEQAHLVVAVDPPPGVAHQRITFTLPLILAARSVVFLATGAAKANAVARVLLAHDEAMPATRALAARGRVVWVLDEEAARDLSDAIKEQGRQAWVRQTPPAV
ncbi:MAG: 6-phosphogluconolactonase [Anaerolineae bacterium]|nr:6-phosphogluconolactonase [Anaerolineae bacterium]